MRGANRRRLSLPPPNEAIESSNFSSSSSSFLCFCDAEAPLRNLPPQCFRQTSGRNLKSEALFSRSQQLSTSSPDIDRRCVDYGGDTALELMNYGHSSEDKPQEDSGFQIGVKQMISAALLLSLDSQQAFASTEFGGAQLISYMGDLGDISTGLFADLLL